MVVRLIFCLLFVAGAASAEVTTSNDLRGAERILGVDLSDSERELAFRGILERLKTFEALHKLPLSNSTPPALVFNPLPIGFQVDNRPDIFNWKLPRKVELPKDREELAFYSVAQLAALIHARKISSQELTEFFLERLRRFGSKLECVVTLTADLAREQAKQADQELRKGKYRGPLHGIPYGAKDLLATKGIRTTWGAAPYTNQVFDSDAFVIQKLREAGAVLVAKLTLGELAMGDVWFGGVTRNPWNPKEGSSGSSAGSAAATVAGLVPFAIGSETLGSIVSPCARCGGTGLRPTFGRVSRTGSMTLSWSMDKLGPITRSVEDAALVFNAIHGPDGKDSSAIKASFRYKPLKSLKGIRIGFVENDQAEFKAGLEVLKSLGADLRPIQLPDNKTRQMGFVLSTEAAAAFDELTRSGRDDSLVRQGADAWPNIFREYRFVPAVEYINANRIRHEIIQEVAAVFEKVDVVYAHPFKGRNLQLSNLTGHPCIVLPNGEPGTAQPETVTFIGNLMDEGRLLAVAQLYQEKTGFHLKHPDLSKLEVNSGKP